MRNFAILLLLVIQQANAGYDCSNAETNDPAVQCGKNQCCSASETCSGLDNASCPPHDSNTQVGCWGCCGGSACNGAFRAKVGVKSCNGDSSCYEANDSMIEDHSCRGDHSCDNAYSSKIGIDSCKGTRACFKANDATIDDNSCNGEQACYYDDYATISDNSCNNYKACYYCSGSTVPSNSCNEAGWQDNNNYVWNQCPYCKSQCKIQATGQDCNASSLQATVSYSSDSKSGSTCSVVKNAIVKFIQIHEDFNDPLIQKLIHQQAAAKLKKNRKKNGKSDQSDCVLDFDLTFFNLKTKQDIESACEAFESLFLKPNSPLLRDLKSNLTKVPKFIATCIRKDRNANNA
mmetsp:Transcript_12254/g.17657  ORF Transcript_12254/g.17657 Transcript_12254/m.17657 type:complete len:347 (-) Transcript_12254:139-1179(-)|eukprot:CAMPEP_0172417472 /NCGR_PEP_ID=MMETSP1064-20121228/4003_1 /TAXON_ID=202472 /ORGANISM="Aulacoseira subarctica , Strain CCAP 1002/5" /LENGTH=346 /DNA_ID=CAMNT_0013155831 /DNA_START=86 /DNA_END=1126 /DNA_ORIENTATION=+